MLIGKKILKSKLYKMNFQLIFMSFLLCQEHRSQFNYKCFTSQLRWAEKLALCAMSVLWTIVILNILVNMQVQRGFDVLELKIFKL